MATPTKTAEVIQLPAMQAGGKVAAIVPSTWQEVTAIAGAICRAKMAPKSYCDRDGTPFADKVAIAIMHGMEVGMTPMASLQSLAVINGMPGLFGDGLVAVVRASGQLEDLQEGLEIDKDSRPLIAWCKVKRKGEASWKERQLTYAECMRAGWTNKDGPWKLTPGRMMTVRVRGWLLRDMFADVLRGLHSAEELQDMVDITPAATGSVPAEPKRSDYVEPEKAPPFSPEEEAKKQPGDLPQHDPQTGDIKPPVTDVVDQNESPPVFEFETYSKVVPFIEFSQHFLDNEGNNANGATQWMAFYKTIMDETLANPKTTDKTKAAFQMLQAMAEERMAPTREPGEEG